MARGKASIPARAMGRGEVPTGPGWFLILWKDGTNGIHEVVEHGGRLHLLVYGIREMLEVTDGGVEAYAFEIRPGEAIKGMFA